MYRKGFQAASPNNVAVSSSPEEFKVYKYMKMLEEQIQNEDNLIEKLRGIYGFKVRNGPNGQEGYWVINAKDGKGKVSYNGKEKPDVTFTINDEDFDEVFSGKLNPQKAYFQGKLKIQGNMRVAHKLIVIQPRIEQLRAKL